MENVLLPKFNAEARLFWEGCRMHKLIFQKCEDCGHVRWPASHVCPKCLCESTSAVECPGQGKIYTYTVFRRAFHPSFEDRLPYVVAVVDLDEGPSILTNIECDESLLQCDQRVHVRWKEINFDTVLPIFTVLSE